jgi:carbonic anhydrase
VHPRHQDGLRAEGLQETGLPIVHGWVFDLKNGLLKDLDIPFEKILDDIREIYRLV